MATGPRNIVHNASRTPFDNMVIENFKEDLIILHEDVLEKNEEGVKEILDDYMTEDRFELRHRLLTEEVHDTDDKTGNTTEAGMNILHRVAVVGSVNILETILDVERDPSILDSRRQCSGETPLHLASYHGWTALVNYIATNQVDLNAKDLQGKSPIHHAAMSTDELSSIDVINVLCVRGADVNSVDNKGATALHYVAEKGRYKTVLALLKRGADPSIGDHCLSTSLHRAQLSQSPETTQILIKYKSNVDQVDIDGNTPLMLAVNHLVKVVKTPKKLCKQLSGYIRGVQLQNDSVIQILLEECIGKCSIDLLLEAQADVNITNNNGDTICHAAVRQGNSKLMDVFIKHNINLNAKNNKGQTCVFDVRTINMYRYLLEHKLSFALCDGQGNTFLHAMSEADGVDINLFKEILPNHLKHINSRNVDRTTPLHLACYSGILDKVKLLCDNGADINTIDVYGRNSLHIAIYRKHRDIVEYLISLDIAINLPDDKGLTPLQVAIRYIPDAETITNIADHAGDLNCRDNEGRLPTNVAVMLDHYDALKVLLRRSALIEDQTNQNGNSQKLILSSNDNCNNNTEIDKRYPEDCKNDDNVDGKTKQTSKVPLACHIAVENNDSLMIQEMIRQKLNVNTVCDNGLTALHLALLQSKEKCAAQLLLCKNINVNTISKEGSTPLHDFILKCNSAEILNLLVERKVKFDVKNRQGDTALHLALKLNRKCFTEILVKCGAGLTDYDSAHNTPCHIAVTMYEEKVCESYLIYLLIDSENNGEHTEERINHCLQLPDAEGKTVLHHVIVKGYTELLTRLVAAIGHRDIDKTLNAMDSQGRTTLHYAVESGNVPACLALIQAGASICSVNHPPYGTTLALAAKSNHAQVVKVLLQNKCDTGVDARNKDQDQHPLIIALLNGHNKVASLLISCGVLDYTLITNKGESLLHLASEYCFAQIVKQILSHNAIDSKSPKTLHGFLQLCDNSGQTALHKSVYNNETDVIDLLLKEGCEVNKCDYQGNSPLHLSAARKDVSYVHADALITSDADINLQNKQNQTPLHLASLQNETDVLELLVANEADVNVQDINGKTALLAAIEHENYSAAEILLSYDADPRICDEDKQNALHKAVLLSNVKPSFINLLIKKGVSSTDKDINGKLPIQLASRDIAAMLS